MKIVQIVSTLGQNCGVALFAESLAASLRRLQHESTVHVDLPDDDRAADAILLHYEVGICPPSMVRRICAQAAVPVLLVAHCELPDDDLSDVIAAYLSLHPRAVGQVRRPVLRRSLPALSPCDLYLMSRSRARELAGLPNRRLIIGSSGFLFEHRKFPDVVRRIVQVAAARDWLLYLATSRWMNPFQEVESDLSEVRSLFPENLVFGVDKLTPRETNLRLQACDLLWCWTALPDGYYSSGVAVDQYGSGTRVVAARKVQHEGILGRPNVVEAPPDIDGFVKTVISEASASAFPRHDPAAVSIDRYTAELLVFLDSVLRRPH